MVVHHGSLPPGVSFAVSGYAAVKVRATMATTQETMLAISAVIVSYFRQFMPPPPDGRGA